MVSTAPAAVEPAGGSPRAGMRVRVPRCVCTKFSTHTAAVILLLIDNPHYVDYVESVDAGGRVDGKVRKA